MPGRKRLRPAPRHASTIAGPLRLLVHTVPGLESVAAEEIASAIPEAAPAGVWRHFDERTSILEYRSMGGPRPWLSLGIAEDIFALIVHVRGLSGAQGGLRDLTAAVLSAKAWEQALAAVLATHGRWPRSYRVVARMAGFHAFRRIDAQRALAATARLRLPGLHAVADDAELELWLTIVGHDALLGARLSSGAMRGHATPFLSVPASLKPSVARAMVRLSEPQDGDVVLDPLCGAGTLLVERASAGPFLTLLGGDLDPATLAKARTNVRASGIAAGLRQWDALDLPLEGSSVDVVLTNPPFGKQIAIAGDTDVFYACLLRALDRVLRPGGRLVLITSQRLAFLGAIQQPGLHLLLRREIPVIVRGEQAQIFVAGKRRSVTRRSQAVQPLI